MRNLDEIVEDIKTVLEEKVEPNVAAHNVLIIVPHPVVRSTVTWHTLNKPLIILK